MMIARYSHSTNPSMLVVLRHRFHALSLIEDLDHATSRRSRNSLRSGANRLFVHSRVEDWVEDSETLPKVEISIEHLYLAVNIRSLTCVIEVINMNRTDLRDSCTYRVRLVPSFTQRRNSLHMHHTWQRLGCNRPTLERGDCERWLSLCGCHCGRAHARKLLRHNGLS